MGEGYGGELGESGVFLLFEIDLLFYAAVIIWSFSSSLPKMAQWKEVGNYIEVFRYSDTRPLNSNLRTRKSLHTVHTIRKILMVAYVIVPNLEYSSIIPDRGSAGESQ